MVECVHCKSVFSNQASLNIHLENTVYCLTIRGIEPKKLNCKSCNQILSSTRTLKNHQKICKLTEPNEKEKEYIAQIEDLKKIHQKAQKKIIKMYEEKLLEKDEQIKELQKSIENIAIKAVQKPTYNYTTNNQKTQINNLISNLPPLTSQYMKETSKFLSLDEHIKKGTEGYANFIIKYFKDNLVCVDPSRLKVKFKNNKNKIVTDPEMTLLIKLIFTSIKDDNLTYIDNYQRELEKRMEENNDKDLYLLLSTERLKMYDLKRDCKKAADGFKTDFSNKVVKDVCFKIIPDIPFCKGKNNKIKNIVSELSEEELSEIGENN